MKHSVSAYFITLTYDDEHLPFAQVDAETHEVLSRSCDESVYIDDADRNIDVQPCFSKVHLQKFIRSVRDAVRYHCKKHKLPMPKFKYFLSCEYGTLNCRPHYHGLIFTDLSNLMLITDLVAKHWYHGFVSVDAANERRCYYAAKYALKSCFDANFGSCADKPFILISKGIGLSFLSDAMVDFMRGDNGDLNLQVHQEGKLKIIPRYYRDKVFTTYVDKLNLKLYFDNLMSSSDILSNSPENCNPFRYRDDNYKSKMRKVKEKLKQEKL